MKYFTLILLLACSFQGMTQGSSNAEYERIRLGEKKHMIMGMDIAPSSDYLAISSQQSFPFLIFDLEQEQIIREFNIGNWYGGAIVNFSPKGTYLILEQFKFLDFAQNRKNPMDFEVVDATSGTVLLQLNESLEVLFSSDEDKLFVLKVGKLEVYETSNWTIVNSKAVSDKTYAIAISPDNQSLAMSHPSIESFVETIPHYQPKKAKKAKNKALKFKQQVSIYNTESLELEKLIPELYEVVYKLKYSLDEGHLFILNIPHNATLNGQERLNYLSLVDNSTLTPMRRGFVSRSVYLPDFKLSKNGQYLGLVSRGVRFEELHVYDFNTGKMQSRLEMSWRLFEKNEGGMIAAGQNASFVFSPDNTQVYLTMGNHIIKWNINEE